MMQYEQPPLNHSMHYREPSVRGIAGCVIVAFITKSSWPQEVWHFFTVVEFDGMLATYQKQGLKVLWLLYFVLIFYTVYVVTCEQLL